MNEQLDVVTGAFANTGQAIAQRLLQRGHRVRTLTGHPEQAPENTPIEVWPYNFDDADELARSLSGAATVYNTYWVRFPHGRVDHDLAVANSRALFRAARAAGVERIVHISVVAPSLDSPMPYFRGKALVEQALAGSGVNYTILRPALVVGPEGMLINNIAYLLRRLPIFAIGGDGSYRIRGIHIDDLADLAVRAEPAAVNGVVNAVGPDRPTFDEFVAAVRTAVGSRSRVIHVPSVLIPPASKVLGLFLRDVVLTGDEYSSTVSGLADVDGPATGPTSILAWLEAHGQQLGQRYRSELRRHFDAARPAARGPCAPAMRVAHNRHMPLTGEYEPSTSKWSRDQVDLYESSGGTEGTSLGGMAVIVLTSLGAKSGKLRKTALMRVEHDGEYAVVASLGGAPKNPVWYYNIKADPRVELQDGPVKKDYTAREVTGEEKALWWERAVAAYPPYDDYQEKTERQIPLFVLTALGD